MKLSSISTFKMFCFFMLRNLLKLFLCSVTYFSEMLSPISYADTPTLHQTPDQEQGDQSAVNKPIATQKENVAVLSLQVKGIRSGQGVIRVALFSTAQGFPDDHAQAQVTLSKNTDLAKSERLEFIFNELDSSVQWAIAVLHDENSNGRLDTNFLGIPKEGIAVSGGPNLWLGKPSFEKCSFLLNSGNNSLELALKYF